MSRRFVEMRIVLPCALQDGCRAAVAERLSDRLIRQPGKTFVASQHRQDVENPR